MWNLKFFLQMNLLIVFMLVGCAHNNLGVKVLSTLEPTSNLNDNIPTPPAGIKISVNPADRSRFVTNLLGPEYLHFQSRSDFYWTKTSAKDVMIDLNMRLPKAKWQLTTDWGHQNALILSVWKKGEMELSILLFDDLDNVEIQSLSKNYGISGPVAGSTMLVMHVIDRATPLR
jgi:hypothetical protein